MFQLKKITGEIEGDLNQDLKTVEGVVRSFSEKITGWFNARVKQKERWPKALNSLASSVGLDGNASLPDILIAALPQLRQAASAERGFRTATLGDKNSCQVLFRIVEGEEGFLRFVWKDNLSNGRSFISIGVFKGQIYGEEGVTDGGEVTTIGSIGVPYTISHLKHKQIVALLKPQRARTVALAVPLLESIRASGAGNSADTVRYYQMIEVGGSSTTEKIENARRILVQLSTKETERPSNILVAFRPFTLPGQIAYEWDCSSGIAGSFNVVSGQDLGNLISDPPFHERWQAWQLGECSSINQAPAYLIIAERRCKVANLGGYSTWGDISCPPSDVAYQRGMSISPGLDGFLEVLSGGAETFNNPGEGWIHCKVPTTPGFQRYPSDEKDAFNYFSTLSPQRERLYRQILAKAKEAGLLVCEFNPDEVDLYEVLSHSGNSRTLRIDDIALGPCDYEPNDLSAQIILRCHPEHKQVGESEVWCIFSNQFALQGETNILKFSRNDDGLLTLKEKVLVSMS